MKIELEPSDFEEVRDVMEGVLDFVPTDAQIRDALGKDPSLLGLAASWYWNDTEVRERMAAALEKLANEQVAP